MKNRGIALIEIVIGSAILSVGILAVNISYNTYINYALGNQRNAEAVYLMQEALEVMTFLRDESWATYIERLSTTTTHYITFTGSAWATSTTPEYVDGIFLRSINIEDVKRDVNDDISTVGTYDPNIKKVTATVSYPQGNATTTKALSVYITNLLN